jgi:hypothetical protein
MAEISAELEAALQDESTAFNAAPQTPSTDTGKNQPDTPAAETTTETATEAKSDEHSQVEVSEIKEEKNSNTVKEVGDDDILRYLQEKAGLKFKSIDDLKSTTSASKEVQKLQKKIAEMENFIPTDESSKNLVKFLKEGGTAEKFIKLQELDVTKMSDRDKMVQLHVLKNGLSKDEAENLVDETYRLSDDEDDTDRTVKAARTRLKIDAKGDAEGFLNKWRQEAVVPQSDLKAQQLAAKWEDSVPKVIDNVSDATTFSFDKQTYKYNFTKEQKDELAETFKEAVANIPDNIDPNTPEGLKYATDMASFLTWGKHGRSIAHAMIESYKANEIKRKANTTVGLPAQNADAGHVDEETAMLQIEKTRYGR